MRLISNVEVVNWFYENSESSQSCTGIFDPRYWSSRCVCLEGIFNAFLAIEAFLSLWSTVSCEVALCWTSLCLWIHVNLLYKEPKLSFCALNFEQYKYVLVVSRRGRGLHGRYHVDWKVLDRPTQTPLCGFALPDFGQSISIWAFNRTPEINCSHSLKVCEKL